MKYTIDGRATASFRIELARLIREADPLKLIRIGAPGNEYDPEVGTILPRLPNASAAHDVRRIVHEEFVRWFDADIAGPEDAYEAVAERIWFAWKERGTAG